MKFNWNASFTSVNFFFHIEAKINVGQLLRRVVFCPKKSSQPADTGQPWGRWANPPTILKFRVPASPLPLRQRFWELTFTWTMAGGSSGLGFFVSSWLAYKRFSCIKIKCIWPIGSIYTTVSKNFCNFSYLKGLESSTADNWRHCPSFLSLEFVRFLSGWPRACLLFHGQSEGLRWKRCLQ